MSQEVQRRCGRCSKGARCSLSPHGLSSPQIHKSTKLYNFIASCRKILRREPPVSRTAPTGWSHHAKYLPHDSLMYYRTSATIARRTSGRGSRTPPRKASMASPATTTKRRQNSRQAEHTYKQSSLRPLTPSSEADIFPSHAQTPRQKMQPLLASSLNRSASPKTKNAATTGWPSRHQRNYSVRSLSQGIIPSSSYCCSLTSPPQHDIGGKSRTRATRTTRKPATRLDLSSPTSSPSGPP